MTDFSPAVRASGSEITTPDHDGAGLEQLLGAWLLTLGSEHSRTAYATDLGLRYIHGLGGAYRLERKVGDHAWLDHLDRLAVHLLRADEVHVNLWRDHLIEAGYAKSTIGRRLVAVSSLYRYLVRRRVLTTNPVDFATRVRVDRSRVAAFSPHPTELADLLRTAADRDQRTSALVHLMLLTGVRVSEAIGADLSDFRTEGRKSWLTVTRKGGEVVEVPVPDGAASVVRDYIGDRTDGPLFLSRTGRMSRSTARDLVRSVGVRSGVSDRLSPHSLRHGFANGAEEAGVPRTQIQADLGHKSSTTTDLYLHAGKRHADFGGHKLDRLLAKGHGLPRR